MQSLLRTAGSMGLLTNCHSGGANFNAAEGLRLTKVKMDDGDAASSLAKVLATKRPGGENHESLFGLLSGFAGADIGRPVLRGAAGRPPAEARAEARPRAEGHADVPEAPEGVQPRRPEDVPHVAAGDERREGEGVDGGDNGA